LQPLLELQQKTPSCKKKTQLFSFAKYCFIIAMTPGKKPFPQTLGN